MEVNYVHKDSLTAVEHVELKKNNELPISYNQVLLKENQELKSIINQIGFEPDEIAFLQQENAELKKQLEELDKKLFLTKNELDMREKSIDNKLNQQKEFIKYLMHLSNWYSADGVKQGMVNEILQKYKSIIGVSDEKEN